jgi:hypothetical protein
MSSEHPSTWDALKHPWRRLELLACLEELATPDPRMVWAEEQTRGLISGIDQVVHFLFDDHEFDVGDVGYTLFDENEAEAVGAVKAALELLIAELPNGGDHDSVQHPLWGAVTRAAASASSQMKAR